MDIFRSLLGLKGLKHNLRSVNAKCFLISTAIREFKFDVYGKRQIQVENFSK